MDEFLNDEQLRRLFERNLPKQQPSPEFVEGLVRRVQAEVRATYSGNQSVHPVARQLANRRVGSANSSQPQLPQTKSTLPSATSQRTGRSWIFSSAPATWFSFAGTVAAILLLAVIFTRTQMQDAIQKIAGGPIQPGVTSESVAFSPTDTTTSVVQTESGEVIVTTAPTDEQTAVESPQTQTDELGEPIVTPDDAVAAEPTPESVLEAVLGSPTPTLSSASAVNPTAPTKTPTAEAATPVKQGSSNSASSGNAGGQRTPTSTPKSQAGTNAGVAATPTRTPTRLDTPGKNPAPQPGATNTPKSSLLPAASPTPTDVNVGVAQPNSTPTRFVPPTPTKRVSPTSTATSGSVVRPISPTMVPTRTATPTRQPSLTPTRMATPTRTATAARQSDIAPTRTSTPIATATRTPAPAATATRTFTPIPQPTNTRTYTPAPTNTPVPTDTPIPTSTSTPIPSPTNSAPVVAVGSFSVDEDAGGLLQVLQNTYDADSDPLILIASSVPTYGSAVIQGNRVFYSPRENFNGDDQFEITVSDGKVQRSGIVNVTVRPVNDPPIARSLDGEVQEDGNITFEPVLKASDVDNDRIVLQSVDAPEHGSVSVVGTSVIYQPNAGYTGSDTFTYRVSDGSDQAEGRITVNVFNISPIANNDQASTQEDGSVDIAVTANDVDSANDQLTVVGVEGASNGNVTFNGSIVRYTPRANFFGTDTLEYTISDGEKTATASVFISVNPVNDAPVINVQAFDATEDTEDTFNPLAGITDFDGDPLSLVSVSDPEHGSIRIENGLLYYTPDSDYAGSDEVDYIVTDGHVQIAVTVNVNVVSVNDLPIASNFELVVDKNGSVSTDVGTKVSDKDSALLSISVPQQPANGHVDVNGYTLIYTPNPGYEGTDSFVYVVSDGTSQASATVSVTVLHKNDEPTSTPEATPNSEPTATLPDATPTTESEESGIQTSANQSEQTSATENGETSVTQ